MLNFTIMKMNTITDVLTVTPMNVMADAQTIQHAAIVAIRIVMALAWIRDVHIVAAKTAGAIAKVHLLPVLFVVVGIVGAIAKAMDVDIAAAILVTAVVLIVAVIAVVPAVMALVLTFHKVAPTAALTFVRDNV